MSRKNWYSIILVATFILITGCNRSETELEQDRILGNVTKIRRRQNIADDAIKNLDYIKDPRTNLCFANLGRSLATVPCESIPSWLLGIAKLSVENN